MRFRRSRSLGVSSGLPMTSSVVVWITASGVRNSWLTSELNSRSRSTSAVSWPA